METKYKVNGNKMGKLETKQKEHEEKGEKETIGKVETSRKKMEGKKLNSLQIEQEVVRLCGMAAQNGKKMETRWKDRD